MQKHRALRKRSPDPELLPHPAPAYKVTLNAVCGSAVLEWNSCPLYFACLKCTITAFSVSTQFYSSAPVATVQDVLIKPDPNPSVTLLVVIPCQHPPTSRELSSSCLWNHLSTHCFSSKPYNTQACMTCIFHLTHIFSTCPCYDLCQFLV